MDRGPRPHNKSNTFVILNKKDYKQKLDLILDDRLKFKKISKDPTAQLKIDVNERIHAANEDLPAKLLNPIIGEYSPGYIYGTVKTHKLGNPSRPIISQIPTPTHNIAKQLNNLINPYLPGKYIINSTDEFLTILRSTIPDGIIASLDVESLFTNVPVLDTIDIICQAVYHHEKLPPLPFEKNILKKLLVSCTTKAPFKHIDESLFLQIDGVAMGSALGVTCANFYMGHIENKVLSDIPIKPKKYYRYVDDCYIVVEDIRQLYTMPDS